MIFGPEVGSNLSTMALAFQSMAADMAAIRTSLTAAPAPPQQPGRPPLWIPISSAGQGQGSNYQTSDFLRLVGLFIGGVDSGRYILKIGQDSSLAFFLSANVSQYFDFGADGRKEIARGLEIQVTPPTAGHAWDVILVAYPFDMDNP